MKKVFIILQFGSKHGWTDQFMKHVAHQEQYGYYFRFFTPNKYKNVPANVDIVDMDVAKFNQLTKEKLGIDPEIFITDSGIPSAHVTDFFIFLGVIFEDYLKDADFWGLVGLDCVIGRIDHFITDDDLKDCDIYTDDLGQYNANFALMRNISKVNSLFKKIPDWERFASGFPCVACIRGKGPHKLFASDEVAMSKLLNSHPKGIKIKTPKYYVIHSHDKMENHVPEPKLAIQDDHSLWDLLQDTRNGYGLRHNLIGREIAYYHFNNTKEWPL